LKRSFYLYLFIFAALTALVIYVNGRRYHEKLENQVEVLRKQLYETDQARKDALSVEVKADYENSVFSLKGNPEAENYLFALGLDSFEVERIVKDELLELNIKDGGNPLIPYEGKGRGFTINDTKFINHKWVLANFTDNDRWGEILIRYDINENKEVEMETVKALLFDRDR
jgi:hypothetical protein